MDIEDLHQHAIASDAGEASTTSLRPEVIVRGGNSGGKAIHTDSIDGDDGAGRDVHNVYENTGLEGDNGKEMVWVRSWGCAHNNSDGEYMAGLLARAGYAVRCTATPPRRARVWVLNSCTVKNPSEQTLLNWIERARTADRSIRIVVAGCVPEGERDHEALAELSVVGVKYIHRVVEVVDQTLLGRIVRLVGRARGEHAPGLELPKIRKNRWIEILPINSGCLNQCTYCKTKHARGDLQSYTVGQIVERAKSVIRDGVREIWLCSEDTGAYGRDIGVSLPFMLKSLLDHVPAGVMVRIGMTNPPYILEHLDAIGEILNHPQVYSFLHVPVQAGADRVLGAMRRAYTNAQFRIVVDRLRELVPGVSIATDIICGFPGETAEEFEETIKLLKLYRFPALHISQFYGRKGTPAARMKRVASDEIKRRSRAATSIFNSYSTHEGKVGQSFRVLCTEEARDGTHWVAHNKSYDQVLIDKAQFEGEDLRGAWCVVDVVDAGKFFLKGIVRPGSINRDAVFFEAIHEKPISLDRNPMIDTRSKVHMATTRPANQTVVWIVLAFFCLLLSCIAWRLDL